jgi:hypothetical protein
MNWTEEQFAEWQKNHNIVPKPEKKQKYRKYRNNRVTVDGIHFDSQLEADKYSELKLSLRMGVIAGFCRQPEFVLLEGLGATRPETYKADFVVFNLDGGFEIIDIKGMQTEVFRIKNKQFKAKFPKLELKIEKAR